MSVERPNGSWGLANEDISWEAKAQEIAEFVSANPDDGAGIIDKLQRDINASEAMIKHLELWFGVNHPELVYVRGQYEIELHFLNWVIDQVKDPNTPTTSP